MSLSPELREYCEHNGPLPDKIKLSEALIILRERKQRQEKALLEEPTGTLVPSNEAVNEVPSKVASSENHGATSGVL